MKNFYKILAVIITILVTFLVIDLFAFTILDIRLPGYNARKFFMADELTGYSHRPNAEGYWYRQGDATKQYVSINKDGFSDQDWDLVKTKPRIALIGDSTTEFWEVPEAQRGHKLIAENLNNQYQVMNFGVRGFGTDQTYLNLVHNVLKFKPDVIIYTFCINDIHDNSVKLNKPYATLNDANQPQLELLQRVPAYKNKQNFFTRYSLSYRLIANSVREISQPGPLSIDKQVELRPYLENYQESDQEKLDLTLALISEIAKVAKENDAKFILAEGLYRPSINQEQQKSLAHIYSQRIDFNKVTNLLSDFSRIQNISFVSLPEYLKKNNLTAGTYHPPYDNLHLNAKGIQLYSQIISETIQKL